MKIKYLLIIALFFLTTNCNKSEKQLENQDSNLNSQIIEGEIVHMVYFWLKNPENIEDRTSFEKSIKRLIKTNKLAVKKHLGKSKKIKNNFEEKRGMEIDNSFDYSLILTFPNRESHRYYQDDPTHLIFGDNTIKLLKKVQIFDSLTESI